LLSSHRGRDAGCPARRPRTEDDDLTDTLGLAHPRAATPPASAARAAFHAQAGDDPDSDGLLARVLSSLDDDKAEDVVPIDLRGRSSVADWMVVASGRSSRQVTAIAEKLAERLKQDLGLPVKVEGKATGDWVLIDAGDVVVHVFRPEVRDFYQLEKMWQPATIGRTGQTARA
jgi:ribosome-associated protein